MRRLVHLTAMKTHDPAMMPSFIRTHVMDRFLSVVPT